jgi:hypothetical protein
MSGHAVQTSCQMSIKNVLHPSQRWVSSKTSFDNTSFSGLLTFTYFLRAFFESKDRTEMLQISTHHRITFDDGLLLIAQPPHFTTSLTTLYSSSPSLPVVKFMVCGECAFCFRQGSICNILEIVTHLQNLLRPRHHIDGELPIPSPSGPLA